MAIAEHFFRLGDRAGSTQAFGSRRAGRSGSHKHVHFRGDLERGNDIQCVHTEGS